MTGFARRESSGPYGTLSCELRSVNHRFLDASVRLPENLRAIEPELRAQLAQQLKRGKVECNVQLRVPSQSPQLAVDEKALEALLERSRALAAKLPGHAQVNVLDLLRWPGVLQENGIDAEALLASARALFADTLRDMQAARQREGAHLAELIRQRCATLGGMVSQIQARLPEVQQRVRERLETRLAELGGELNRERVEQEIVLLLQRLDVAEELDRLRGHIEEAGRVLKADEPAGRRLDFLLQEFNREANTLSSKSQDLETTRTAVEMKVVIEQMREQVQNIE